MVKYGMNKKPLAPLLVLTALTCIGIILTYTIDKPTVTKPVTQNKVETTKIIVDYPKPNDIVTSPLIVKGRARGTWFFEGDFPVTFYYGVGEDFVETYATAKTEWMTEDYVEFEATINFPVPPTNDGLLVLRKNNPSDLEENNESVLIKVRFH